MATFQQKLGNVKESLASLFKARRRRSLLHIDTSPGISTPQNVRRVMHITFDAGRQSFDGIPTDWRPHFEAAAVVADVSDTCETRQDDPSAVADDDSGVSMATGPSSTPVAPPIKGELLSLTFDRDRGRFVDLPPHWQDRLQRNNLLEPEFQKNPDLLVTVFALMDEELKTMQQEGFKLERGLYSSSPADETDQQMGGCPYFYEIEADHSNSSSEQNLQEQQQRQQQQLPGLDVEDLAYADDSTSFNEPQADDTSFQLRQPSLVRLRAVAAPRGRLSSDSANSSFAYPAKAMP